MSSTTNTKTNKRRPTSGYSRENMEDMVALINRYPPAGKWRRVELSKKLVMTTLHQMWLYKGEKVGLVKYIVPWGMKVTYGQVLSADSCKIKTFLPPVVKEKLGNGTYSKDKMKIKIEDSGPSEPIECYRVFCRTCQSDKELLPALLKKHEDSLGTKADIWALIRNFDSLKIPSDKMDLVGCFLPWDAAVEAGPCARCFLRECSEHVNASHIYTKEVSAVATKRKGQATIASSSSKKPLLASATPSSSTSSTMVIGAPDNDKQCRFTLVSNKNKAVKQRSILDYNTKVDLLGKCKNRREENAKGTCLSVIHTGVAKMISNAAILDNYTCTQQNLEEYHSYLEAFHSTAESECGIKLPPPIEVSLTKNNISKAQRAILDGYRYDNPNSIHQQLKKSPIWAITHDGISKFGCEYNGILLRGVTDNLDPLHVPHALRKMKGGVTGHDTATDIINITSDYIQLESSAFEEVKHHLEVGETDDIKPLPPTYFKLGTLLQIDEDNNEIHIELSKNMPIANTGDGVGVNGKAVRVLLELYGIKCADFRCSVHIAGGVVKRLTTSKTMNVQEVTTLYETLRTVIKHFESSVKNKEILDEAMENVELSSFHLISWCQTRMAHFLTACKTMSSALPAVYDVMATLNVRAEERDILFTVQNIYILKLISCIEPIFMESFLRPSDKTDVLVNEIYNIAQKMIGKVEALDTADAYEFLESVFYDENGNLMSKLKLKDGYHTIRLSHHSKPSRIFERRQDQLKSIKEKMSNLKTTIVENIVENINDQNSEKTW